MGITNAFEGSVTLLPRSLAELAICYFSAG